MYQFKLPSSWSVKIKGLVDIVAMFKDIILVKFNKFKFNELYLANFLPSKIRIKKTVSNEYSDIDLTITLIL